MPSSTVTPIAASRITVVASEIQADDDNTSERKVGTFADPRIWTLGDYLIAAFSLLSLVFAVVGVLLALG